MEKVSGKREGAWRKPIGTEAKQNITFRFDKKNVNRLKSIKRCNIFAETAIN